MRKLTPLFMVTTLVLGAVNMAHAATEHTTMTDKMKHHHVMNHPGFNMFKGLNLTAEQQQKMQDIMKSSRENMKRPSVEERRATHEVIAADSFDRSRAETQAEKMTANAKENALMMLETQNKMYNVLTPEQKKQYNARFDKHLTQKTQHDESTSGE